MRIKELEDVLTLVDRMPKERQMECVRLLLREVELWEDRVAFQGDEWEYLREVIRQSRASREQRKREWEQRRKPPR